MKVDGNKLAEKVQLNLKKRTDDLLEKGITPHIAIVTVGEEDTWKVYISHKLQLAKKLNIRATIYNLNDLGQKELENFVSGLNENNSIHGIIIQRPLPPKFNEEKTVSMVKKEKDIDGFRTDSPFISPVARAVDKVLQEVYGENIKQALKAKRVVVLGKGVTGGGPTIQMLKAEGAIPTVVDTKSTNREETLKDADIIISAVGKEVVKRQNIKKGAVLIGIGARVENNTLKGDYSEKDIKKHVKAYTSTPGGIGPLNLTYLFTNLIKATELQTNKL